MQSRDTGHYPKTVECCTNVALLYVNYIRYIRTITLLSRPWSPRWSFAVHVSDQIYLFFIFSMLYVGHCVLQFNVIICNVIVLWKG
jgi:hypothetical protein